MRQAIESRRLNRFSIWKLSRFPKPYESMIHIKKAFDPAPEPLECSFPLASPFFKIVPVTLFFRFPPRQDLLWRPSTGPHNPSLADEIMGFAGKLPIANRWRQGWPSRCFLNGPVRGTDGRAYLCAATAGTKMQSRTKLFRYIQNARFKGFWHVVDFEQLNPG